MKKLLVLLLATVFALGCFGGCGGIGGTSEDESGDEIKISVGISSSAVENKLMRQWKASYEEKHPEIKILLRNISEDYTSQLMSYQYSPSTMPDIIWTTDMQHMKWSDEGIFVNLKSRIERDTADDAIDLNDFYESMIEVTHKSSRDDGIYFIPRDYNRCVIIINRVVFRHAGFTEDEINGLKDGWNYDKLMDVCARLRTAMDNNLAKDYGVHKDAVPLDANMDLSASYMPFLKQFGGKLVEDDGSINFMSEANLNAYGQIYNLIEQGYIAHQGNKNSAKFTVLRAAMRIDVRPNVPALPNTSKYDIDFLPLPLDYVGVGCSGYAISSMAKQRVSSSPYNKTAKRTNEDYAYDFLKYIVSAEGQKIGAANGNIIPVLKSLANDESWTTYKSASLNHAAFVSNNGEDFSMNVYRDFTPQQAAVIIVNMGNTIAQVIKKENYTDGGAATGYAALKEKIGTYQNNVKNYRAAISN